MGSFLNKKYSFPRFLIFSLLFVYALGIPLGDFDWDDVEDDIFKSGNASDTEILNELGINQTFLHQLEQNLEKAIEEEKQSSDPSRLRQGGNGGGIGDFFGVGGGGGGNNGNGFQNGGGGEEEDDEEEPQPPSGGPGPFGVLTGLFGLFSGLGTLNPRRVLQSTVNFFPPDQRQAAQNALDMVFGLQANGTGSTGVLGVGGIPALLGVGAPTLAPLTDAPAVLKGNSTADATNSTETTPTSTEATLAAKTVPEDSPKKPEVPKEVPMSEEVMMAKATTTKPVVAKATTAKPIVSKATTAKTTVSKVEIVRSTHKPISNFNEGGSDEDVTDASDNVVVPSLEQQFAATAEKLRTQDTNKPESPVKEDSIEKDFAETGAKLTHIL